LKKLPGTVHLKRIIRRNVAYELLKKLLYVPGRDNHFL
jgi:hypothetical protein